MAERSALKDRYRNVMERVGRAAERSGRRAEDVHVIAVTKTATPEQMRQLIELGQADFGENRVQLLSQRVGMTREFLDRHRTMTSSRCAEVPQEVRWHMIGHLQRNKVKAVLPLVRLIHSVDSLRLAEEIQNQAAKLDLKTDVLIQVNAVGEKSKFGVALPASAHLAEQMMGMNHLRVRGLMTMAPFHDDPDQVRPAFERTADTFNDMVKRGVCGPAFNILSMGMTNDFEVAIEAGANVVRIGRAIFGEMEHAASA